jgi:gas vesicle protein
MATRKTKKRVKIKPRKTRKQQKTLDQIHYGPEPDVDYFEDHSINDFFNWYNYMWDKRTSMETLTKYANKFGYKNAKKFKKMIIPPQLAYLITGLEKGLTFPTPKKAEEGETGNEYYQKYLHAELRKHNKKAHKLYNMYLGQELNPETTVKKKRKTVQENINNKVQLLLAEVDYAIDVWDVEPFDMYKYLSENNASATVAKKIPEEYQELIDEVTEAAYGKSKQLKEGYNHMTKSEKTAFINFVKRIQTDSERYAENHKPVRKAKKAKVFSAQQKVSKLNFLKEDVDNKITSIEPSKIVGAEILFLFNARTNQLSYYQAIDRGGLDVTGTTIKRFDTDASAVKKLGAKTTHFLDRVLGGGKIVLNKIMNEINSKASKVTGRVNNNMIILKVN